MSCYECGLYVGGDKAPPPHDHPDDGIDAATLNAAWERHRESHRVVGRLNWHECSPYRGCAAEIIDGIREYAALDAAQEEGS